MDQDKLAGSGAGGGVGGYGRMAQQIKTVVGGTWSQVMLTEAVDLVEAVVYEPSS